MNTELGTQKVTTLLRKYSIPSIISLVFIAMYNLVDQIFIGWGVGYLGNACTNVLFPISQIGMAFGAMIGDGTAAYINLKRGAGEEKEAEKGIMTGLSSALAVGVLLSILLTVFLRPLCSVFGATEALMPYALDYGTIIVLGMVFSVCDYAMSSVIRANGAPRFAMAGIIVGCGLNIIGDPLLIFVFGMGVKGAAIATVFGQAVHFVMNAVFLSRKVKLSWLTRNKTSEVLACVRTICFLGLSSFVAQFAMVIGLFIQNNLFVYYGAQSIYGSERPLAAFGIAMKVFMIMQQVVTGVVVGAQPVLSYNYGAKSYKRVKETIKWVLIITFIILAFTTLLFQVFPEKIISIFGIQDALYMEFAVMCLRIFLALLVVDTCQMTITPIMQALGKSVIATVFVLQRQLVVMAVGLLLFGHLYGVVGLLYSGPFSSLTVGIAAIIVLVYQWRKLSALEAEADRKARTTEESRP